MGSRDFGRREKKKSKKETKKAPEVSVAPLEQPTIVEVIKTKGKKQDEFEGK